MVVYIVLALLNILKEYNNDFQVCDGEPHTGSVVSDVHTRQIVDNEINLVVVVDGPLEFVDLLFRQNAVAQHLASLVPIH